MNYVLTTFVSKASINTHPLNIINWLLGVKKKEEKKES